MDSKCVRALDLLMEKHSVRGPVVRAVPEAAPARNQDVCTRACVGVRVWVPVTAGLCVWCAFNGPAAACIERHK